MKLRVLLVVSLKHIMQINTNLHIKKV